MRKSTVKTVGMAMYVVGLACVALGALAVIAAAAIKEPGLWLAFIPLLLITAGGIMSS